MISAIRLSGAVVVERRLLGLIAGLLMASWAGGACAEEVQKGGADGHGGKSAAARPSFSWERIPLYMHIRKATSFTEKETAFIARFPLITFEKANGHAEHASVEKGTLAASRAVKRNNPKATILYYRNVFVHYEGYAANRTLGAVPNALLVDKAGDSKLVRGRVAAYDLSNAELREWWVNSCSRMSKDPAIDGIFLDGNIKALEPSYLRNRIGVKRKQEVMGGYHLMMKQTREAIGPEKLMVANILRARFKNAGLEYLDYFDGSYLEGFFHNVGGLSYEEYAAKGIDAMQQAAGQGKIVAFTTGLARHGKMGKAGIDEAHGLVDSEQQARANLVYPLAIFLIAAGEHSYFRVHEGYAADESDRWMRWFPEYDKPLGPPRGIAKRNGFRYTRRFQHATVSLDLKERAAEIRWKPSTPDREQGGAEQPATAAGSKTEGNDKAKPESEGRPQ